MKSFNKKLIAFKRNTKMDGKSLAKLFGYSEGSISNFLNGKSSPRRARKEKILNYMSNYLVLPTTWNELVSPPVVEEKTIRNAQVGEVVVGKSSGYEHLVLERGQNTVILSKANEFKKSFDNYHFDELEERYTLKVEPEVVDDKTAEAMKLLKEAGYKITKD